MCNDMVTSLLWIFVAYAKIYRSIYFLQILEVEMLWNTPILTDSVKFYGKYICKSSF